MSIKYGIWSFIICFVQRLFHRLCQLQSTARMIWRLETKTSDLISSLFTATLEDLKKGKAVRQAVRQAVRNTDRQPNRQAVRQTHRHTDRQTHFMIVLQVCWLSNNFDSNWFDLGDVKYFLPELNFSFLISIWLFDLQIGKTVGSYTRYSCNWLVSERVSK